MKYAVPLSISVLLFFALFNYIGIKFVDALSLL